MCIFFKKIETTFPIYLYKTGYDESAKLRATRAKKVLTNQRVLRAYVLMANVSCVLMCSRANAPGVLTCSRTNVPCVLTCPRANVPCVLTCSRANVSCVLTCSSANVPCALTGNLPCVLKYRKYQQVFFSSFNLSFFVFCIIADTSNALGIPKV